MLHIYKCGECGNTMTLDEDFDIVTKAPCPRCDTCDIRRDGKIRETHVYATQTCTDIFDKIKSDGR